MSISPLLLFLFLGYWSNAIGQGNFTLVSNSKSQYVITIPAFPTSEEKKAAYILQEYITKISGCELPVRSLSTTSAIYQIQVGRSNEISQHDTLGLSEDGILIKSTRKKLIITGGRRMGVLNSVFTFLEDFLGCQRYAADDLKVPIMQDIILPLDLYKKYSPSFNNRMTFFHDSYNYEYSDWRKLNFFMSDWGLWVHSFEQLMPKEIYFLKHPEYYALVNGKRTPSQIDLTNRDVLLIFVQKLRELIAANPKPLYWSVSQNDNEDYCNCINCRRLNEQQGSPQGSLLTFVNLVAGYFPDKIITTLAYSYSEKPPLNLEPASNVMVMLATGAIVDRRMPVASIASLPFNDHFKKWSKICTKLFLWDYIAQYDHIWLPFPNFTALQPNIKYFASKKVFYLFEQGIGDMPGAFSELKCYIISKLMWNYDENVDTLTTAFLEHYYGTVGAKYIYEYMKLLQSNVAKTKTPVSHFGKLDEPLKTYLSTDRLEDYKEIFKKALDDIDINGKFGQRILKEYLSVLYAELENNKYVATNNKGSKSIKGPKLFADLSFWYVNANRLKIKYVSLPGLTIDDYYKSYLQFFNGQ